MHRPIFGRSFAMLVAPVLSVLAFYFLNKKRTSARRNAEDVDTGASGLMAAPTETNSDGTSPSPTKANNGASSSMAAPTKTNSNGTSPSSSMAAPTETNSDGTSPSPTKATNGASSSMAAQTETNSDGSSPSPIKANNDASSSLTGNCYEVFLSFRGPDTRHCFADHLYNGLVDAGIEAFKDDDEICHGEEIRPVLMEAIKSSKILIPIFSVNYGTSSWCLDELVQMMECKKNNGQIVLPIFYKVKPAHVGHQIESFGDAFHNREKRLLGRSSFDAVTLEKWKKALLEVSTLKGDEAQGSEADLVKLVVRKVLSELKKKFELVTSENLVGIESHVNKVMEFVNNKSNATLVVGIHGMGGIGKTTLAKTIYNKLSNQFEHRSFMPDIRESWKRNGVHYLQNQLIYQIFNRENEVCNADMGTKFISSMFKSKKVLVLLDDVDDVVQLQSLAGNRDWFSSRSRIIITTRNKKILEEYGVDHDYEHKEMDDNQSLIMFSKRAFRRDSPPKGFEKLTHEVVSITGGLPLSLEVFSSLLCGKESTQWRDTIEKLKKVPPMKVQEKLRISYEALDYRQKQIFLDIACLFIGTNKIIASYMWDACDFYPGEGIEVLIFMSLIKVGDDHKLQMHDQLRDLGREIVREENQEAPWCRSRLWDYEEAQKVLKGNKGTDKIKAINLSKSSAKGFNEIFRLKEDERDGDIYTEKQFKNLTNLRYLHMINAHLSGDFEDLMKGLKWLRWQKCPVSFEVNNFDVKELVVLELQGSRINEKWEGWSLFKMAEKLKYLDLSYCESLEDTDFFSTFKMLEVLILWGNKSLSTLPDSIRSLENLKILNIRDSGIEELPKSIGMLRNLQELYALNCRKLKRIMVETMCNLSSLRHLDFRYCESLQSLPNLPSGLTHLGVTYQSCKLASLSHLANLKELRLDNRYFEFNQMLTSKPLKSSECSQPTDVEESKSPQSLNTPFKLEFLGVRDCRSIEMLDISQSIHLRTLDARSCHNILEVRGLDKSIYLESLIVRNCHSIKWLDLPKFKGLKKLDVAYCKKLAEIQGLDICEHLESLDMEGCTSMERLSLPKSERLEELNAKGLVNLAKIQGLDGLKYLERLNIKGCTSMERLDLTKSERLKELDAGKCKNLATIQGLDKSKYLESLDISRCTSIGRLDLPKSKSLKRLEARDCKNLVEIQGLDRLESLGRLDISGCTSMKSISRLKSKRLEILKARYCANLVEIQGLDGLKSLEMLDISRCTSIGRLDLPKFGSLKRLKARGCKNLVEIQGLDTLEYLGSLDISGCTSMKSLSLLKSKSLEILKARDCANLVEIQGLDRLESLEMLNISRCTSIERLLLSKSKLKILKARNCENLVEIQGLDRLEVLEELNIIGCVSLKTIPKLSGTRIYQYYEITNDKMIV